MTNHQAQNNLNTPLRNSLVIHLCILVIFFIGGVVLPKKQVKFVPSLRVDLVDLPDAKKSDLNQVKTSDLAELAKKIANPTPKIEKPELREVPIEKADMALQKKSKKIDLKNALDKIKTLNKLEEEVSRSKKPTRVAAKGSQISKGDSLTGQENSDLGHFQSQLISKIRENWNLPVWLTQQKLSAQIDVFLDSEGYVSHTAIRKSSGNKQFDDFAIKAIRLSQPFGSPPPELSDAVVTLGFPL